MIIPFGYHCAIINLNIQINIKHETTAFEWFQVETLQSITDVFEYLYENPHENVIKKGEPFKSGHYVNIYNENIKSLHYKHEKFIDIFKRRWKRVLDNILNSSDVWFVRYNKKGVYTSQTELELFIKAIRKFNPNCILHFLLIDTINKENFKPIKLNEPNVIFKHDYFLLSDTKLGKPYMEDNKTCSDQYKNMLIEMNYPFNDIIKKE